MNTTYLLITLAVCLIAILGWYMVHREGEFSNWVLCAIPASVIGGIMLLASCVVSLGVDKVVLTPPTRIESTPYRVIVVAFGRESVWTDAYTVANVGRITQVRQTTERNAWGGELGSTYAVVFKEAP